ncbi:riboflavin-aldehyde forming enzyme [Xylariales sp. PMI_506]|nr:riboflavin-aldehyde forming enzyme [Xylariales sp. PMI_506]
MARLINALLSSFCAFGYAVAKSGDMTFFAPGLGACGWTSSESDAIVALSKMQFTASNPNHDPVCGKTITITLHGVSTTATVVDECPECAEDDIDVSPAVFENLDSLDVGRVEVDWEFA